MEETDLLEVENSEEQPFIREMKLWFVVPFGPVINYYQGGKRPRSSMSPTIVTDKDNKPFIALGTPGGSRIIGMCYGMNTV